ncbi:glycoside hydrolase family 97 protein [Flindersiella endophytica]
MSSWTCGTEDGILATVSLSEEGALTLAVRSGGRDVLLPSRLGIRATHKDFSDGLTFVSATSGVVDDSYTTVIGRRRSHTYHADELVLHFRKGRHRLELHVRVSADGVAYRYVVPWTAPVTICGEATRYVVPPDARSVLLPYDNGRQDYETIHEHATVATATPDIYGYPALFRVGDTWMLVTESDLDGRYAGSQLVLDGDSREFRLVLPDPYVTSESPLVTPWRTMIIGSLATVVESSLITSLAPAARFSDTSWVRPGIAAWSWWSDGESSRDPEAQKAFVDFASSVGWAYVLVDAGWKADWVPELVTYARARNVGIWLWDRWQNLDSAREHRERLGLWREWGVVGVKIDFTESDGQDRMRWFDRCLEATAHHRLMVNFHGGTIPRGLERTWPHFMTAEAVKGAENIKPNRGKDPLPPRHYVTLAFTRNVQGPMDFTPVTFTSEREITASHELALAVLYESGVQHFADSVESYRNRPVELGLLSRVPSVWDETRLLSGDPATHVVLARRHDTTWYIAGGYATDTAQTAEVALPFLPEGDWTAELYHDSPTTPHDEVTYTSTTTTRADTLKLPIAPNGGFTLRLTPKE